MKNVVDGGVNVNVKRIEKDFQTTAVVGYVEVVECCLNDIKPLENIVQGKLWVIWHLHRRCVVVDIVSIAAVKLSMGVF